MAIWKLTIEDDEGQKTVVPLVRDEYTVGRREGHTIRLTERNISRDHARIRRDGDGYVIEDLGSYNGVFVNGHRVVDAQRIQNGDLILIGDYRVEAHNEDAPARVMPIAPVPAPQPGKPSTVPPPTVAAAPAARNREHKAHRFVLLTGIEGGKEYPLDKPMMMVGRGEEADIRVNHSSVSRNHCEVHSIDGDHFEVHDSGSANGIRVNGQDVKRALLAPGDTLELGDVALKYIAAGQAFVFDASVAEAYRDRGTGGERRRGGVGMWAILAVCVAGAAVGGVVLAKSGGGGETSPSGSVTGAPVHEDALAAPYKLKQDGDAFKAHASVAAIGKDSPLRKDKRFVEIENAWADKVLKAVPAETDPDKRREMLKGVLESGADESYRTSAADMLGELDKGPDAAIEVVPTHTAAPTSTTAKAPPTATTAAPTATSKPTSTATTTATAKPTATATAVPPGGSGCATYKGDYSAAMRDRNYDCVKSMLMPRLNSGSISSPEARYLKAACGALGDHACEKRAAEKI